MVNTWTIIFYLLQNAKASYIAWGFLISESLNRIFCGKLVRQFLVHSNILYYKYIFLCFCNNYKISQAYRLLLAISLLLVIPANRFSNYFFFSFKRPILLKRSKRQYIAWSILNHFFSKIHHVCWVQLGNISQLLNQCNYRDGFTAQNSASQKTRCFTCTIFYIMKLPFKINL